MLLSPRAFSSARLLLWLLRAVLGLAVLGVLLVWIPGDQVRAALRGLNLPLWGAAVVLYLAGQALCAWKWGLLARALGMPRPYRAVAAYYFGGMFANLFLPTTVGGDLGRAAALARPDGTLGRALITVLADRGSGFAALLLLATGAAGVLPGLPLWLRLATLCAALLLLAGGMGALTAPQRLRRLGSTLQQALLTLRRPATLGPVLAISLLFQMLVVLAHLLLGQALGLAVFPGFYVLVGTLTAVVAMAPLSVNGLGTRDAAYVYLLGLAHVPPETGLAFALSWLALILVSSGIGGLAFALMLPGQVRLFLRRQGRKDE